MSTLFEQLEAEPTAAPTSDVQPSHSKMRPRDYQQAAIDAVFEQWQQHAATLVVLPTGCGKTIVFASITDRITTSGPGRVLVLAHREELIHQAVDKIELVTGERPDIEMADYKADQNSWRKSRVVVASKDTLRGGRLTRFDPTEFAAVITDEAHHAVAKSYQNIYHWFSHGNPDMKFLGVTATPDRTDEEALGQVFESVAYVYEIQDAINDGYLVPIQQRSVMVEGLDFSAIKTTAGDLNQRDLAVVMEYEENLHKIADPTIELSAGRKTLLFASSVAHAERLAEIFNRHHADSARWVCGDTPKDERQHILREYAAGRFQFLCNVGVFTEGFDDPSIEVVALARPTKSRSLFAQMVGRGTRPLPGLIDDPDMDAEARRAAIAASAKPSCEVIDFEGNVGRHKLVTVADILGGNYSDEVVERAAAKAKEAGAPTDVLEQLSDAEKEIRAEKERQRKAEERRRARVKGKAAFNTKSIDPFDVLQIEPRRERGWEKGRPPTDRQMVMLKGAGVDTEGVHTASQASQLIASLIARREHGWCTFKQAKVLKRFGYEPKGIRFEEANRIIDQCFAGKRPDPSSIQRSRPEPVGVDHF